MKSTRFTIKKGLDLPIDGAPESIIEDARPVTSVAVIGRDFVGMKPTMMVNEGDRVKLGQPLFEDKKTPGVFYTAPGAGEIVSINRGAKRVLQSVVIRLDSDEEEIEFEGHDDGALDSIGRDAIQRQLIDSGLWVAIRTRPFSKVPSPGAVPRSIFVNCMDSNPLAADPQVIIRERADDFQKGLRILAQLTDGKLFITHATGAQIPAVQSSRLETAEFEGPHPAGLVGTHIHHLDPVSLDGCVWHVGYQDVIAMGTLFSTGRLDVRRVIALGGPSVERPRLLRTRLGANTEELLTDELKSVESRAISGSVLSGRRAAGWGTYLSRYDVQLTVLPEGREREFMGWIMPGRKKFSKINVFLSSLLKPSSYQFTTSQNGSPRAMVPIGNYEEIMPLDILPTQLLRSLLVRDTDMAQVLGCLELDEEDLALCSFVCVGKYDYGPHLRGSLDMIEKEG